MAASPRLDVSAHGEHGLERMTFNRESPTLGKIQKIPEVIPYFHNQLRSSERSSPFGDTVQLQLSDTLASRRYGASTTTMLLRH
jgi:hypothetical protein